ncbi:hypothetical protein BDW74DRAFT_179164 [Aspergillus multicolor]|uniref:uncharacterized protein n=1 Tax=Aspergillus multicolor TaxID=41759 RepID=UPI003CCCF5D0
MNLQSALYYTLLLLGAIIGGFMGRASSEDYEINRAVAPKFFSYIHDRIPAIRFPTPPLPKTITQIFTRKDRTLLAGYSHGFKYVYRTADLNRLSRSQRDKALAAVENYFEKHTGEEIDAIIAEGDELVPEAGEAKAREVGVDVSWTAGTGTACLKLDDRWGEKGKWGPLEGYMKIGREEKFDEEMYCGPTFTVTILSKQFDIVDKSKEKEEKKVDHEL